MPIPTRILEDITRFVFVDDPPEPADIILLPGGSHPEQAECAAALYGQGLAPLIMPSGRYSVKHGRFTGVKTRPEVYSLPYATECAFMRDVLRRGGVPPEAILDEDRAMSTQGNADCSRALCDALGLRIRRAILCCKNYHARRCLMFYQLAFPDTEFIVHAAPYHVDGVYLTAENWHTRAVFVERVMGELRRYGDQFRDAFLNAAENSG